MKTILGSIVLLLFSAATGVAAPSAELERLNPFIDPYTVVVAQLNLNELDIAASSAALVELVPEWQEMLAQPIEQMRGTLEPWHQQFRQAGGERLYILVSLNWLGVNPPIAMVAPMTGDANAERLKAAFAMATPAWPPRVMHNCIVTAPEPVLRHLEASRAPGATGHWKTAFEAAPAGFARVVMVPYAESGRVIEDLLPTLPPMLGGGPGSVITRGFQWATLALRLPPAGSVSLTIQSESADAAVALLRIVEHGLTFVGELPEVRQQSAIWNDLRQLMLPVVAGNRLESHLEFAQLAGLVQRLQPLIAEAMAKGSRVTLMNQLKQIGLGLMLQAGDHGDRLPDHLVDILQYVDHNARLFLLPGDAQSPPGDFATLARDAQAAWIDAHTPFVYVLPGRTFKQIQSAESTVLVYERPKWGDDSKIGILFADGHVELRPAAQLKEMLDSSGARPQ